MFDTLFIVVYCLGFCFTLVNVIERSLMKNPSRADWVQLIICPVTQCADAPLEMFAQSNHHPIGGMVLACFLYEIPDDKLCFHRQKRNPSFGLSESDRVCNFFDGRCTQMYLAIPNFW